MPPDPSKFLPVLFAFLFVGMWCLVLLQISSFGWRQVADQYPATSKPEGRLFSCASGRFSLMGSYSNCLNVIAAMDGLYVEPLIPFRLFHRPILLPWHCVMGVQTRKYILFGEYTAISIQTGSTVIELRLPAKALSEIQSHVPPPLAARK